MVMSFALQSLLSLGPGLLVSIGKEAGRVLGAGLVAVGKSKVPTDFLLCAV
jgi:hypothetical protein